MTVDPREWVIYTDEYGENYYYNVVTRMTQWEIPFDPADIGLAQLPPSAVSTPVTQRSTASSTAFNTTNNRILVPPPPLISTRPQPPPGSVGGLGGLDADEITTDSEPHIIRTQQGSAWEVYRDENNGREYYYNPRTQVTTWTNPLLTEVNGFSSLAATTATTAESQSSMNWVKRRDGDGFDQYYNTESGQVMYGTPDEFKKQTQISGNKNKSKKSQAIHREPRGLDEILSDAEEEDGNDLKMPRFNMQSYLRDSLRHDIVDTTNNNLLNSPGSQHTVQENLIDFLKDETKHMTYSRQIALKLMDKPWYNPRAAKKDDDDFEIPEPIDEPDEEPEPEDDEQTKRAKRKGYYRSEDGYPVDKTMTESPSLAKAWAYFEHVALSRYIYREQPEKGAGLDKAEPGDNENPTRLYSFLRTPHNQLGDFGLGIGLYFTTLKAIVILSFLCFALNLANISYFISPEYSAGQTELTWHFRGSAICTEKEWVPCPTCNENNIKQSENLAKYYDDNLGMTLVFASRYTCGGDNFQAGMVNFATMIFVIFGIFFLNRYVQQMEVQYDEDEQTAQDYSVVIENPPKDASDPEEWRDFFKKNFGARLTALTIAVNNDKLVQNLVQRRETMRMIEMSVEPGTKLDAVTLAGIAAKIEQNRTTVQSMLAMTPFGGGIPELYGKINILSAKIKGLSQLNFDVTNVFATFETETCQRKVLSELNIGTYQAMNNSVSALSNARYLFRDRHVLKASEPDEPNTIRWDDLNATLTAKITTVASTTFATCVAAFLVILIVKVTNDLQPTWASIVIAIFNTLFPMFGKALTDSETHPSEGLKQTSLYFKIALFRWLNTAVVIALITPFPKYISTNGAIQSVFTLFWAEITTTAIVQYFDPAGHFARHFSAPRAQTQDAMNLCFQGTKIELAERYTNMTKILFLAVFYCAIYPHSFGYCALALLINYWLDRFSLMRTWKRVPNLGTRISSFSRRYFFSLAIAAMAVMSSYFWASFPYDNLCENKGGANFGDELRQITGNGLNFYNRETGAAEIPLMHFDNTPVGQINSNGTITQVPVSIQTNMKLYHYCQQDFFARHEFPFVPGWIEGTEDYWMDGNQKDLTLIYGWTSVGVLIAIMLSFVFFLKDFVTDFFRGTYSPRGEDQGINFSTVESISAYIPQVESTVFAYPLLACSVDKIDDDLFDWQDPDKPHAYYDLTKDAKVLIKGMPTKGVNFSTVTHWPPGKDEKKIR